MPWPLLLRFGPYLIIATLLASLYVSHNRVQRFKAAVETTQALCLRDKAQIRANAFEASDKALKEAVARHKEELDRKLGQSREAVEEALQRGMEAENRLSGATARLRELQNEPMDCSNSPVDDNLRLRSYGNPVRTAAGRSPGN